MSNQSPLPGIIRAEIIAQGGCITFERFMELALYHPAHGYYTSRQPRVGKAGDFFTNVSVGALFGKILARQFIAFREQLGNPPDFQVVEFGGHHGQLRADVRAVAPDLDYRVIEVDDPLPDKITGCIFSNEFLDALPVHRVEVRDGQWWEVHVSTIPPSPSPVSASRSRPLPQGERQPKDRLSPPGERPGHDQIVARVRGNAANQQPPSPQSASPNFFETLAPLSNPRLAQHLAGLPVHLMEGYRTEINLRALDWLDEVAQRLHRGYIMTIDYGHERNEYFAPHRRAGTLLCYARHTKNEDPYRSIGEQDITAHVEFTSFIERGERLGLKTMTFTDQGRYLLEIGEPIIAEIVARTAGQLSHERQAIHQLIHPELMGRTFKVLIQGKETGEK